MNLHQPRRRRRQPLPPGSPATERPGPDTALPGTALGTPCPLGRSLMFLLLICQEKFFPSARSRYVPPRPIRSGCGDRLMSEDHLARRQEKQRKKETEDDGGGGGGRRSFSAVAVVKQVLPFCPPLPSVLVISTRRRLRHRKPKKGGSALLSPHGTEGQQRAQLE